MSKKIPQHEIDQILETSITEIWAQLGLGNPKEGETISSPFREDKSPSLQIGGKKNITYDHGTGEKLNTIELVMKVKEMGFREAAEFLGARPDAPAHQSPQKARHEAVYDYTDESGKTVYKVVRVIDSNGKKSFPQKGPDGKGGWTWGAKGAGRVLYHLPSVIEAVRSRKTIYVVEGEKDADNLRGLGVVATSTCQGAVTTPSRWEESFSEALEGANRVVVLTDNDEPGKKHGEIVASKLLSRVGEVKVIELPGLKKGGDVSDWIEAGGTREDLIKIVESTAPFAATCDETPGVPNNDGQIHVVSSHGPEREVLTWEPYPVGTLPDPLRKFISHSATAIGCDPSFIALPLLTLLAAAIGNTHVIRMKPEWDAPVVVWSAIVGKSGQKKTPAFGHVLRFATELEAELQRENHNNEADFKREMEEHGRILARIKKGGAGEIAPDEPAPVLLRRFLVNDATLEALSDRLSSNPRGLLMAVDELDQWFESLCRYRPGGGSDRPQWLSMHGANTVQVDRKTGDKPSIFVPRAAVSITGGIQPSILNRVMGVENRASGLFARFLLACPPPMVSRWSEQSVPEELILEVRALFKKLFETPLILDEYGVPIPKTIPLSPEAKDEWVSFYDLNGEKQGHRSEDECALWAKIEGYVPRFALIIHCVKNVATPQNCGQVEEIDSQSIRAAIALGEWHGREGERIYQMLTEDDLEREQHDLIELILRSGGGITIRDLQRGRKKYRPPGAAEEALNNLVEAGFGEWENVPSTEQGGRPTKVFHLSMRRNPDNSPIDKGSGEVLSHVACRIATTGPKNISWGLGTINRN